MSSIKKKYSSDLHSSGKWRHVPSELVLDVWKQRNGIKNVGHKLPNDKAPHVKDSGL